MQGAMSVHAHAQQITAPARLVEQLQGLRPPTRSFAARCWDRFIGRRSIRAEKMQLAQLAQSTLYRGARTGNADERFDDTGEAATEPEKHAKEALEDFVRNLFVLTDGKVNLDWRNPEVAAQEAVRKIAEGTGDGHTRKAFQLATAGQIRRALAEAIGNQSVWITRFQREDLADVIYAACVGALAKRDDAQAREDIKTRFSQIPPGDVKARVRSLRGMEASLQNRLLGIPERAKLLAEIHQQLRDTAEEWLRQLSEGLSLATPPAELRERLAELRRLESIVSATHTASGGDKELLASQCAELRIRLTLLESRERDQAALAKELETLGKSTTGAAPTRLELAKALAQLDKASDYLVAKRALDHIRSTVTDAKQGSLLRCLCESIQAKPDGKPQVRDRTYLLGLIHQGDADIIDRVFHGPEWHEDAWRLKAAAIPPGDERALKNLDVQHNLRIVALELDRAMQHATLNQTGRGEFSSNPFSDLVRRLRKVDRPEDLPRNVFSATRPDAKLLGWFMRHAPGIVADRNLVIANWISLSCYDPATGTIDKSRTQPLFDTLRLQGLDPGHIEQYIQQGFRNGAAVVKCREQVCKFARALDDAKLLKEMEQARSVRYRAEELTQRLLREVIGTDPAGMSSEQIAERMKSGLKHAAPHATENMPAKLARLTVRREELLTEIMNGAGPLKSLGGDTKLDWIKSAGKLAEQVHLYQHALDALMYHDILSDSAKPAADRAAAEAGLQKHLGALKYFNILKLRENTDTLLTRRDRGLTPKTDIGSRAETIRNLRAIQGLLRPLRELAQVDSTIAAIRPMLIGSSAGDLFVERAMRVAILQEAVASGSVDFTPQAKAGAVLKRLASFGFQPGSSNENMRGLLRQATEHLTQNARSLEDLCKLYDVQEQARSARAAVTGKSDVLSALKGDVRKKRAENAKIIRSQFQDLGPDSSLAIRFGAFGELSVSLPVLFVLSVSSETQVQRDNAITISREEVDGKSRYTLKLVGGASVRSGVSVDVIADLLSAKGFVGRGADQGFSFTFDDREACMNLALALAGGDPADPRLWQGASVQTDQAIGKGAGASIEAGLDLGVLALEAQAQIQGGREVSVQESAFGRTETYGRHFEATSSAAATLIGDLGDREVEAGIDRTVTRTLKTALGMFAPDCELTVSARVVGGNLDRCLRYVLPPGLAGRIDGFRKELEGVDEGTQLFVRCGLDPQVRVQANELLAKAEKILLDATQGSREGAGRRHEAAREEARKLVVEAYALTERPGAYIPQGLGWTTQALVEVTSSRKVFDYFASSEALETRFLPFETPVGPLRDDVEV